MHEDNLFDRLIAKHPEPVLKKLDKRYGALTLEPRKLRFIDRIVADSRDVALNHTAGLSLPQQVMMTLFSLYELMDEKKHYQKACIGHRPQAGRGDDRGSRHRGCSQIGAFDYYYGLIDFEFWARKYVGEDVVRWMKDNVHPLDIVFRLAEDHGIVLLNGSGFDAPNWSVRVSFANLDDHVYDDIGRAVRAVARSYRQAYEAGKAEAGDSERPSPSGRARRGPSEQWKGRRARSRPAEVQWHADLESSNENATRIGWTHCSGTGWQRGGARAAIRGRCRAFECSQPAAPSPARRRAPPTTATSRAPTTSTP